jgi:hypothetical protein
MRDLFHPRVVVAVALLVGAASLAGCAARITVDPSVSARVTVTASATGGFFIVRVPESRPSAGIEVRAEGGRSIHIPPGHYPTPGQCRIWRPGVPPGLQGRPGACHELERRVPPGAYLVYG